MVHVPVHPVTPPQRFPIPRLAGSFAHPDNGSGSLTEEHIRQRPRTGTAWMLQAFSLTILTEPQIVANTLIWELMRDYESLGILTFPAADIVAGGANASLPRTAQLQLQNPVPVFETNQLILVQRTNTSNAGAAMNYRYSGQVAYL